MFLLSSLFQFSCSKWFWSMIKSSQLKPARRFCWNSKHLVLFCFCWNTRSLNLEFYLFHCRYQSHWSMYYQFSSFNISLFYYFIISLFHYFIFYLFIVIISFSWWWSFKKTCSSLYFIFMLNFFCCFYYTLNL